MRRVTAKVAHCHLEYAHTKVLTDTTRGGGGVSLRFHVYWSSRVKCYGKHVLTHKFVVSSTEVYVVIVEAVTSEFIAFPPESAEKLSRATACRPSLRR